jgi:hypothetical protein
VIESRSGRRPVANGVQSAMNGAGRIELDEAAIRGRLAHYMDAASVVAGIRAMVTDRFLLAFFLMSVSEGEAMGEAGVAAIREEEIAQLIHDIERQQREEAGHKALSLDLARELFPDYFDAGQYRYRDRLTGRAYYLSVLQENRQRLKERGRYSRLNLYLTTTFGYEIMVGLYYGAVIDAVSASDLPARLKDPIAKQLRRILDEESTHLEIATQHNALVQAERAALSTRTVELLEGLEKLTADDYEWAAELSMRQVVELIGCYADGPGFRARIEGAPAEGAA